MKYTYLYNTKTGDDHCYCLSAKDVGEDIKVEVKSYDANEVSILRTTDEDGNVTDQFTDHEGKLILTRQKANGIPHDTYIVYDGHGRKRVVLPPLAADALGGYSTFMCSQVEAVQLYGYLYYYDERDRCIKKKLPGCEPIYYVYDRCNYLVLKQDGNDREAGRWQSFQYDRLGRQVIWGFMTRNKTHADWIRICKNLDLRIYFIGASYGSENYGYTSVPRISYLCTPLIINYYDDYEYTTIFNEFIGFLNRPEYYSSFSASSLTSRDKLTGQVVALLNDPFKRDCIAYYYDQRGREVQSTMNSAFGFRNYTFTNYDFIGQPVSVRKEHTSIYRDTPPASVDDVDHILTYEYEYDHAGRLSKLYQTYDNDAKVLVAKYEYDEVGRLEKKLLHNETATSTYKYNVRGWPTEINEPRMSQKIYYNENLPQGVTPLYNGNIPCLSNTADNNLTSHFTYDGLNRLVSTKQYRPDGRFIETPEKFTYDKMGNVLTIERSYYDPYPDYLNEMTIQYHGNQIKKVTDESRGHDYYVLRYQDAANKDIEYFYDSNGNLVKNLDNKIGFIKYNIINLPEAVAFNDGNLLTYSYMADGRKVRDSYGSFPIRTSTPLDSIVNNTDPYITEHNDWSEDYYYSGRLYRIATPEGFIRFVNRVGYSIFYSMKDHVGSFRGYWEPGYTNGPITFSYPSYHPSGIIYRKPYTDVPFALGGKEFMGTNNLDEYFFGARTMYAIMNRFNQMDPLCEKYYSVSPYAYCMNNPVRFVDPDGKDSFEYDIETRKLTWINDVGGKESQTVDFVKGYVFFTYRTIEGENIYVYALKEGYAITNFDANFDDRGYNAKSGYEYSFDDFIMRNEILKDPNPIGSYILDTERLHGAEPITRRDAELTYGSSLMNLVALTRTMETALQLVDTGVGSTRKIGNSFNLKSSYNINNQPQSNKNSWNQFLRQNKGRYRGANWLKEATKDYYNSSLYKNK
ncbi:type IV secretion protein Rhs [Bacteroides salyersiae]|nr:type IV secretion protein Rhs [Bacteroides salyersiae]